jgi:CPA2 family monovalent cation:H+ antiporter-2
LERWLTNRSRVSAWLRRPPAEWDESHLPSGDRPGDRAVVVGFGPTGRAVTRLFRDNGISPTVIELRKDAVGLLRKEGVHAIYGDAARPETLAAAGVAQAGSLILGSAGMSNSAEVIRMARDLNPHIRVLARAAYLRDVAPLKQAGANSVYSGEGEVALAFVEDVLHELGATPEQIDRERDRAHGELSLDRLQPADV